MKSNGHKEFAFVPERSHSGCRDPVFGVVTIIETPVRTADLLVDTAVDESRALYRDRESDHFHRAIGPIVDLPYRLAVFSDEERVPVYDATFLTA